MPFISMLIAAILGALGMFFMDPQAGKTRRHQAKEQADKVRETTSKYAEMVAKRTRDRAEDAASDIVTRLQQEDMSDESIVTRVRAELGRLLSYPNSVQVTANRGVVSLRGKILTHEISPLLERLRAMYGINDIDNRLDVYDSSEDISEFESGYGTTS